MKAHISLIKKDLFLMGNYLCFIPVFTLVLPFFYYWRLPDFSLQKGTGLLILIVASVYSEFLAYEQIFLKDAEYPKALSLLCASPYRRRDIVLCRYLLFCLVFIATAVIYYTRHAAVLLLPPHNAGICRCFFPEYIVVLHTYASSVSVRL